MSSHKVTLLLDVFLRGRVTKRFTVHIASNTLSETYNLRLLRCFIPQVQYGWVQYLHLHMVQLFQSMPLTPSKDRTKRPVIVIIHLPPPIYSFAAFLAFLAAFSAFVDLFPIFHPHPLKIFTTFGVNATVAGTRIKIKLLWIAYASANFVARLASFLFALCASATPQPAMSTASLMSSDPVTSSSVECIHALSAYQRSLTAAGISGASRDTMACSHAPTRSVPSHCTSR
jgi:hypothetical protein